MGSAYFVSTPFTQFGAGEAAFMGNPTLLTTVGVISLPPSGPGQLGLVRWGVDGLPKNILLSGPVSDPVWSSRGELAVVRRGWIWVGRPGKLRRLTRGSAPSWSPDGKQLAFARGGWVRIGPVRQGSFWRLVQGTAPAWSPDGRWIAFFGRSHRLNVVQTGGGRARHVGTVTGTTVDWQPLPAKPPARCLTPPGSTVIASSNTAIVSADKASLEPSFSYGFPAYNSAAMGCLRADGRERLLAAGGSDGIGAVSVSNAAVAGNYAALVITHSGYNRYTELSGSNSSVRLFDLRTAGALPGRGGQGVSCPDTYPQAVQCQSNIDSLVLGPDAVSAVHTVARDVGCTCTVEQIQASDSTGVHMLDSITEPDGSPTALTNLTLTGDTLTWNHNGSPRSAQLQP